METKPCIMCGKQLKCALPNDDWSTNQPYGGGEVKFIFAYGSCKFDNNIYSTEFVGVICDDCAEKCVDNMIQITEDTIHAPEDQECQG